MNMELLTTIAALCILLALFMAVGLPIAYLASKFSK